MPEDTLRVYLLMDAAIKKAAEALTQANLTQSSR